MQLIVHVQMYADTHTKILFMVFAIQGVKTTFMYKLYNREEIGIILSSVIE